MTRSKDTGPSDGAGDFDWTSRTGSGELDAEVLSDEHYFGTHDVADDTVHGHLMGPDGGGNDDVAELVATEIMNDDPLTAEEAALHTEEH